MTHEARRGSGGVSVDEQVIRAIAQLVINAVNEEIAGTLSSVVREIEELKRRQDSLSNEVQAVASTAQKIALSVAHEFVRQTVEAAIASATKGVGGQISVATEPVVARLDALSERVGRVERLLESSAQGLKEAVDLALESVKRAADEGVKRIEGSVDALVDLKESVSKISKELAVLRSGLESISKQLANVPRREDLQRSAIDEKVDALLATMEALRRRIDSMERQLAGASASRRREGGGKEDEDEVEL